MELRGDVHQNDDRELEPLRLVDGHQADAVAALFENRRLGGIAGFGVFAKILEKSSERNAALGFVAPRQLGDVGDVREHLLASVLQREADVRAGRLEQRRNGGRNGHAVARAMKRLKKIQRRRDRRRGVQVWRNIERMETSKRRTVFETMAIFEQLLVADREERAAQRRENR